jgi:hypothetical protein
MLFPHLETCQKLSGMEKTDKFYLIQLKEKRKEEHGTS